MRTRLTIVAIALAAVCCAPSAASAEVVLGEDFESGAPGWAMDGLWHVKDHPESVSVASDINPALVTLPDSGQLPAAAGGTHALWYGEDVSGTFCTGYTTVTQSAKNGCESAARNQGRVVSPSFSLVGAESAQLVFTAWWEIEAVNADDFDLMKVQYSVDGGAWTDIGALNPVNNPAGEHFESYSNNGLEVSPSWRSYVASLGDAIGSANVRIGFLFDTVDANYQGFRGLLIDNVSVSTPFTEGAPEIAALDPGCVSSTAAGQVVAISGDHFVIGSGVTLDGAPVPGAATLSSTRMEFTVSGLAAGSHTVQVINPLGAASNPVTLTSAPNCAAPPTPPPPGPGPSTRPQRTTATQVICNRGPNPNDTSVCIATVGDSDAPPRTTPTGTVTFTSTTGTFASGSTCTLTPTPMSPGVASCSAIYTPPAGGGFPAVTATYNGDDDHLGSSGATSFIIAGPPGGGPSSDGPPNPDDCGAILAGAARAAGRGATLRIDTEAARTPLHERGVGYCLWYTSSKLLHHGINVTGQGVVLVVGTAAGIGAPAVGIAGGLEVGGPGGAVVGGSTGLAVTKEYVYPATRDTMNAISEAQQRALQDPPDPKFRVVVRPEPARVAKLTAREGLGRRAAAALTALAREQARARSLADAISASIDKAGGAKLAGDEKWVGVQTRAFIGFAERLSASLNRLVELQQVAASRAARSALLTQRMASRKQVARRLARTADRGFTKRERRGLRREGMTKAQIEDLRAAIGTLKPGDVSRSAADLIGQQTIIDAYRAAAEAFDVFVHVPSVLEDAAAAGSTASTSGPSITSTSLRHGNGGIAVDLTCGASATGSCEGTLRIRKGRATLAQGRFRMGEESSATVTVEPTSAGRRAIAGARRHDVTVVVKPAAGPRVEQRLTLRR